MSEFSSATGQQVAGQSDARCGVLGPFGLLHPKRPRCKSEQSCGGAPTKIGRRDTPLRVVENGLGIAADRLSFVGHRGGEQVGQQLPFVEVSVDWYRLTGPVFAVGELTDEVGEPRQR